MKTNGNLLFNLDISAFASGSQIWKCYDGKKYITCTEDAIICKLDEENVLNEVPELAAKRKKEHDISQRNKKLRTSPANVLLHQKVNLLEDGHDCQDASQHSDTKVEKSWTVVKNGEEQIEEEKSAYCIKVGKNDDVMEQVLVEDDDETEESTKIPQGGEVSENNRAEDCRSFNLTKCLRVELVDCKAMTSYLSSANDRTLSMKLRSFDTREYCESQDNLPIVVVKRMKIKFPFVVKRIDIKVPFKITSCETFAARRKLRPRQCNNLSHEKPAHPGNPDSSLQTLEPDDRTWHLNSVDLKSEPHSCTQCEKSFHSKTYVLLHIDAVHKKLKPYSCDECGQKFSQPCNLRRHMKNIHKRKVKRQLSTNSRKAFATKSRKSFADEVELNDLVKNAHNGSPDRELCKAAPWELEQHACPKCRKSFDYRTELNKHVKRFHKILNQFVCESCRKPFSNRADLNWHVNIFHAERKEDTTPSKRRVSSAREVALQIKNIHKELNHSICDMCLKTFSNRANLNKHVDAVHRKLKPYTCHVCDRAFFARANLNSHVDALHKKLKPYTCHVCDRAFFARASLNSHVDVVHKKLKPYTCHVCKRAFSVRADLNKHVIVVHRNL